jgi:fimbrial chaperone protein
MRRLAALVSWLVLCVGWSSASVQVGSFQVNPVRLTLIAPQTTTAFTVTNRAVQPVVVQFRVVAWRQEEGQDVYVETQELLVTPPIISLEPEKVQTVRVGLRRPLPTTQELTYRVYVQEVPGPPQPGVEGVQVMLQIGMPVFVRPQTPGAPVLRWQAQQTADGTVQLRAHNAGNIHIQIQQVQLRWGQQPETTLQLSEAVYLLPGQMRQWSATQFATRGEVGQLLRISARTDQGVLDVEIPVGVP